MAPSPFRRRKAAKTVRNLAIAEAALALAKDRALAAAPGRRSRRPSGKLLLLGGAVAAAGAAALLKRDKVAGLLPSRAGEPERHEPPAPPQQSNYDAPGPVANTATPVPAPDSHEQPPAAIDERAEEEAAAAEAAAIGGTTSAYAGPEGERADEAERPLAEAGEGESEGDEQADADLEQNAEFRDDAPSDAERQIEDTIEEAAQPSAGETPETVADAPDRPSASSSEGQPDAQGSFLPPEPPAGTADASRESEPADDDAPSGLASDETISDAPGGGISGRPFAGLDKPAAEGEGEPAGEPAGERAGEERTGEGGSDKDDDSDDWRTWSGRSVNP